MMFKRRKRAATERSGPPAEREPRPPGPPVPQTTQFLTGDQTNDRRKVQVLLEAIARVSEPGDLDAILVRIVDRSIEVTGAERGLLLLQGPDGELRARVARVRGGSDLGEDVRFSTTVARRVFTDLQPVRATVQSESEALELGRSVYDLKLRAVMCVPLASPRGGDGLQRPAGVLYVDSRAATRQFDHSDLSLFFALAQHIAIALDNARLHLDSLEKVRLEQSLELAGAIQRDLMPPVPRVEGYDVFGWYRPAEVAAGDFYDFVPRRDGGLGIVVGDVTGHGIGPALITASAQASLRSSLRFVGDPGEAVSLLNEDLAGRIEDGRFLTLFLGVLSPDGSLASANAGHASPLVRRAASGAIEVLPRGGPALGMVPGERYRTMGPIPLASGDVVCVFSDGLTEARSRGDRERMVGEEGIRRVLAERADAGARELAMGIAEAVLEASAGSREDDMTIVVARRR